MVIAALNFYGNKVPWFDILGSLYKNSTINVWRIKYRSADDLIINFSVKVLFVFKSP